MPRTATPAGEEVLTFFARQRLAPTPPNYTLAYLALVEPGTPIARAVVAVTDGGVRLRQDVADEIFRLYTGATSSGGADDRNDAGRSALRYQTLRLGEVASSAAAASGDFSRELVAEAEALGNDAARTVQIVSRMIERSRRAEDELNATAREVEVLRQELEAARDDAERDQLTGLGNRRAIERHLQTLSGSGRSRVIGICDIDRFKSINDRYGHGVGDRVLKLVASTLAASCSPHFVGRWGGEEFLLVLEGADPGLGVALLDAARADLSTRTFKLRETDEPIGLISFSAGVAVASGDHRSSIAAIHRADKCLYRAKAEGRNRVIADVACGPAGERTV